MMPPHVGCMCVSRSCVALRCVALRWCVPPPDFPVTAAAADNEMPGFEASVAKVHRMLDDAVASGVPSDKIVVGGFSQGAALSMASVLCTCWAESGKWDKGRGWCGRMGGGLSVGEGERGGGN